MSATPENPLAASRRPIHAPMTDVPVGAIAIAAAFDVISAAGGDTHAWARELFRAGTFTLMAGTTVMALAVVAGFVDRAHNSRPSTSTRGAVNRHAMTMSVVGILSVLDIALRRNHYEHALHTPAVVLVLTVVLLAATVTGATLGGKLVYRRGVGVVASR